MREYCLVATVHDNSSGMSSEEIDKAMLSLHSGDQDYDKNTKNILKTVANHGFSLAYNSVEGEGTTIKVLIPFVKSPNPVFHY